MSLRLEFPNDLSYLRDIAKVPSKWTVLLTLLLWDFLHKPDTLDAHCSYFVFLRSSLYIICLNYDEPA